MDLHKKIEQALATLRQAEGKSFFNDVQATERALQVCNILMAKRGYHALPEDYAIFLMQVAGVTGPYFTLLTFDALPAAGGGLQPGMLDESDSFNKQHGNDEAKTLVVGKMSGNALVIYEDGKYNVVDAATRDVFRSYDDIAEFIVDTVQKKDAAIRAAAQ